MTVAPLLPHVTFQSDCYSSEAMALSRNSRLLFQRITNSNSTQWSIRQQHHFSTVGQLNHTAVNLDNKRKFQAGEGVVVFFR